MKASSAKHKLLSHYLSENPESASVIMMNAGDEKISSLFNKIRVESLLPTLNLLPQSSLAEAFRRVEDSVALSIMNFLPANSVAGVFRQWRAGDGVTISRVNKILKALDVDQSKAVSVLLNYIQGSVGSLMNPIPLSVKPHMTVKEVLALLEKKKNRYSRYIYVVDSEFCLQGVLPFKEAFYSEKNAVVSQIMTSNVFSLNPEVDAKKAISNSSWRKWDSIPVVDTKKRLIGVIRFDALENSVLEVEDLESEGDEIQRAGAAVGEIFQIGINATIAAMGINDKKGDLK